MTQLLDTLEFPWFRRHLKVTTVTATATATETTTVTVAATTTVTTTDGKCA